MQSLVSSVGSSVGNSPGPKGFSGAATAATAATATAAAEPPHAKVVALSSPSSSSPAVTQ